MKNTQWEWLVWAALAFGVWLIPSRPTATMIIINWAALVLAAFFVTVFIVSLFYESIRGPADPGDE